MINTKDENKKEKNELNLETITLVGGCFWCTEAIFEEINGVKKIEVGYAGGQTPEPNYEEVCKGNTDHAEVTQITFNTKIISLKEILRIFFLTHDPTTLNQQGYDIGTQYRSIILHDNNQKGIIEDVIKEIELEKMWDNKIVTEISPLRIFHKAEEQHQRFYSKNPNYGYCQIIITPKITEFRKKYLSKLKKK